MPGAGERTWCCCRAQGAEEEKQSQGPLLDVGARARKLSKGSSQGWVCDLATASGRQSLGEAHLSGSLPSPVCEGPWPSLHGTSWRCRGASTHRSQGDGQRGLPGARADCLDLGNPAASAGLSLPRLLGRQRPSQAELAPLRGSDLPPQSIAGGFRVGTLMEAKLPTGSSVSHGSARADPRWLRSEQGEGAAGLVGLRRRTCHKFSSRVFVRPAGVQGQVR